jgi:predicted RNA-binding Zn-ribbon protein involved in translation (DUF1610 family)
MTATTGRRCPDCGAALRPVNRSGYCQHCSRNHRCDLCGRMADGGRGHRCATCRQIARLTTPGKGGQTGSATPERIEELAARAALGVPLFARRNDRE